MRSYIKILLMLEGFWFFIASIIDGVSETSNPPNWFEYLMGAFMCLGLWAIIDAIEENKKL